MISVVAQDWPWLWYDVAMIAVRDIGAVGMGLGLFMSASAAMLSPQDEAANFTDGEIGTTLAELVEKSRVSGFSGAVLAAREGKVIAAVAVGDADLQSKQPNTPATLFELASLTKQFTAAAVMRLVADGKLALDDPIARHLPDVPENCRGITIEHLLRHTSGIPGSNSQGRGDDFSEVLPLFLKGGPAHEPGTHWEYWNQGYALLTEVIAVASGRPYTDYCREALFAPAGMTMTRFTGDDAPEGALVAIGRSRYGPPRSALEHPYGSYGFQYRGMGGAVSSVWDLWRWDRALHGDQVLDAEARAALFKPGLNDYALGWYVRRNAQGRLVQSHGGGVRGFVCELRRYPEENALLIVLSNSDGAPLRQLVPALETVLFGDDERGASELPLSPLDELTVAALAGTFRDHRGNVLVIKPGVMLTSARIHWSPPDGPVTQAALGLDDDKVLSIWDGEDKWPVTLRRSGDEPVSAISVLGLTFQREDQAP